MNKITEEQKFENAFHVDVLEKSHGCIIGATENNKILTKRPNSRVKGNMMITGQSGMGKTESFVVPLIYQTLKEGDSLLINDPGLYLYEKYAHIAIQAGYQTHIIGEHGNISERVNFDIITWVGGDKYKAIEAAKCILENSQLITNQGYESTDKRVLLELAIAVIMFIYEDDMSAKTTAQTYNFLTACDCYQAVEYIKKFNTSKEFLQKALEELDDDKTLSHYYETLKKIIEPLCIFSSQKDIAQFEPVRMCMGKTMVFVDTEFSSNMACILEAISYDSIIYVKQKGFGMLPISLHIVLDEINTCKTLSGYEKRIGYLCRIGVYTYFICAEIAQLKNAFPEEAWESVIRACGYYLYYTTHDRETIKCFTDRHIGTITQKQLIEADMDELFVAVIKKGIYKVKKFFTNTLELKNNDLFTK